MPFPVLMKKIETGVRSEATPEQIICERLSDLLNTRVGAVPSRPDYGLPDLADLLADLPLSTTRVAQVIQNQIQRFEPLIKNVRLTPVFQKENILALEFHIELTLTDLQPCRLTTRLIPSGHVEVFA